MVKPAVLAAAYPIRYDGTADLGLLIKRVSFRPFGWLVR